MLNRLESRFINAGFRNIQFVIVNVASIGNTRNGTTYNGTVNANNITIINNDDQHKFLQFDFYSAYVFDQCERLAYIIYSPWSSIQRPYVKASILSTIYDGPCGECDISFSESSFPDISTFYSTSTKEAQSSTTTTQSTSSIQSTSTLTTTDDDLKISTTNLDVSQAVDSVLDADSYDSIVQQKSSDKTSINPNTDQAYIIPIKIIIRAKHAHQKQYENDTFEKFDYIVLKSNDSRYHEHLINDKPEVLKLLHPVVERRTTSDVYTETDIETNTVSSVNLPMNLRILFSKNDEFYESITEHTITDDKDQAAVQFEELISINLEKYYNNNNNMDTIPSPLTKDRNDEEQRATPVTTDADQKNDEHYGKILQWIHFNL